MNQKRNLGAIIDGLLELTVLSSTVIKKTQQNIGHHEERHQEQDRAHLYNHGPPISQVASEVLVSASQGQILVREGQTNHQKDGVPASEKETKEALQLERRLKKDMTNQIMKVVNKLM